MLNQQPRLLTTKQACYYLWGDYNRSLRARLIRSTSDGTLKSVRFRGKGRHFWSLEHLKELIDPVRNN